MSLTLPSQINYRQVARETKKGRLVIPDNALSQMRDKEKTFLRELFLIKAAASDSTQRAKDLALKILPDEKFVGMCFQSCFSPDSTLFSSLLQRGIFRLCTSSKKNSFVAYLPRINKPSAFFSAK